MLDNNLSADLSAIEANEISAEGTQQNNKTDMNTIMD